MIKEVKGDVLSVSTGIIVHGCNCLSAMGSGIAASVKERFPTAYEAYIKQAKTEGLKLGNISYVEVSTDKFIVNALTQRNVYPQSSDYTNDRYTSYDAIVECFNKVNLLAKHLKTNRSSSPVIYFPLIGAVRGGGDWKIISYLIDSTITEFDKVLYLYDGTINR